VNNWRWMLFSGAIPAVIFFVMLFFIRKSPRWLVRNVGSDLLCPENKQIARIAFSEQIV
jgi:MFS family permease